MTDLCKFVLKLPVVTDVFQWSALNARYLLLNRDYPGVFDRMDSQEHFTKVSSSFDKGLRNSYAPPDSASQT